MNMHTDTSNQAHMYVRARTGENAPDHKESHARRPGST
jgi:hypothetical protein